MDKLLTSMGVRSPIFLKIGKTTISCGKILGYRVVMIFRNPNAVGYKIPERHINSHIRLQASNRVVARAVYNAAGAFQQFLIDVPSTKKPIKVKRKPASAKKKKTTG